MHNSPWRIPAAPSFSTVPTVTSKEAQSPRNLPCESAVKPPRDTLQCMMAMKSGWMAGLPPVRVLDVSLDQLRTLAVVHTTGTAQRAARVLGREQSSVQKQLDNLNKAAVRLVGEALVVKQGRGKDFLFTPAGEEVVALATETLRSWTDSLHRSATEPGRPPALDYDFLEWHHERVALLTNLTARELPDTPVTAATLPGLPLLAPTAGLLSQFLSRWYGPGYRGELDVIADIDSLTYGLNLLNAQLLHGCLLTTERVADAALEGRLPGRDLRKIDLADDYEPALEIVTGIFARKGERERYADDHPLNLRTAWSLLGSADLRIDRAAHPQGGRDQAPVRGPQCGINSQLRRCQQLCVDVADAEPVQLMTVDERHDLLVGGDRRLRQAAQQPDDLVTLS